MTKNDERLFRAAGPGGDLAELRRLLENGANPNQTAPVHGNTPLYNACFADRPEAVRILLDNGADPNQRITYASPVDGRVEKDLVALMLARSPAVVRALLEAGADPNARDETGRTPLMRAALSGSSDAVERLLEAGADTSQRTKDGHTASDLVASRLAWLAGMTEIPNSPNAVARRSELENVLSILAGTQKAEPGSPRD